RLEAALKGRFAVMWTLFLPIVERATRKSVHINTDYVDILQSVYIIHENVRVKERVGHESGSSGNMRTRNGRTGRSGSASGMAGGSVGFARFLASTLANRSSTSAG